MEYNDQIVDKMLRDLDDTVMPMPSIDDPDPLILIAQVRRDYYNHLIRTLSVNYETHQKLIGKNIYLPSAIWRCAKYMELQAAKMCMVTDLYRRNILKVLNNLKLDTEKGKLNKQLFNCLKQKPMNEKKLQTNACTCQCTCNAEGVKRRKTISSTATKNFEHNYESIPDIFIDTRTNATQATGFMNNNNRAPQDKVTSEIPNQVENLCQPNKLDMPRMSTESQPPEDEVMLQMEQMFRADSQGAEDDLFEGTLCDDAEPPVYDKPVQENIVTKMDLPQNQAQHNKSLDQRLAQLEYAGILNHTKEPEPVKVVPRPICTKWLCETYYQKKFLYEKMDDIRERNRKKHLRIRVKFYEYFGDDSDGELEALSPPGDGPEFARSCKERIAPWVVNLMTPHYQQGRIIGKNLFKACAKHLIALIIICSQYPDEQDVKSFIGDFLKSHKMIRCEADFIEFKIANI